MDTLTDRYVWAVTRRLPHARRADAAARLRSEIATGIAAKQEAGTEPGAAELATLTELGDPERRSAELADRPAFLIGPDWFFDYRRIVTIVIAAVAPSVFGGLVLAQALAGREVWAGFATALSAAFTATVQVAFWITVAFAILERVVPGRRARPDRWDASNLPTIPTAKVGVGETIFAVLAYLLILGLVLWQRNIWVIETAGDDPLPLLDPELWSFWIPWFLVLAVLEIGYALIAFAVGRWTWGLAWVNVALNLAFAVPAVWLLTRGEVLSAEFLATFRDFSEVIDAVLSVIPIIIVIVAALDIVDGFRKAYRGARPEGDRSSGDAPARAAGRG